MVLQFVHHNRLAQVTVVFAVPYFEVREIIFIWKENPESALHILHRIIVIGLTDETKPDQLLVT